MATLAGCSDGDGSTPVSDSSISGTIDFNGPVNLENVIRAELHLVDHSIADSSQIIISEAIVTPIVETPETFNIYYKESDINQSYSYSVTAAVFLIDDNDEEYRGYITTQIYPVLTNGFGSEVNLLVEPIS